MNLFVFSPQSSFIGAIAIGDLVKSTLGPKGMVGGLTAQIVIFEVRFSFPSHSLF